MAIALLQSGANPNIIVETKVTAKGVPCGPRTPFRHHFFAGGRGGGLPRLRPPRGALASSFPEDLFPAFLMEVILFGFDALLGPLSSCNGLIPHVKKVKLELRSGSMVKQP